jgi:hypothetical protein
MAAIKQAAEHGSGFCRGFFRLFFLLTVLFLRWFLSACCFGRLPGVSVGIRLSFSLGFFGG